MLERAASESAGLVPDARVSEPAPPPWRPVPARIAKVASAASPSASASQPNVALPRLTLEQLWERARRLGPAAPHNESTAIIRRDRDERHNR